MRQMRQEKIEEYFTYREEIKNPEEAKSQKEFLLEKHLQRVRNLEKKYSIKNKKGEM